MQMFVFGLLLACVSGVTVVAFNYPNGFARLFPYLLAMATALFIDIIIWLVAVELTWRNLVQYMAQESLADAENTKGKLILPYAWIGFWYLGVVGFLWINLRLPRFLKVSDEKDARGNKKKSTKY